MWVTVVVSVGLRPGRVASQKTGPDTTITNLRSQLVQNAKQGTFHYRRPDLVHSTTALGALTGTTIRSISLGHGSYRTP